MLQLLSKSLLILLTTNYADLIILNIFYWSFKDLLILYKPLAINEKAEIIVKIVAMKPSEVISEKIHKSITV